MAAGIEGLKAANTLTAQVITISAALLAFTVTFAEKFAAKGSPIAPPIPLKISWVCFILTIFLGFWTLMAVTGTLNDLDRGETESNPNRSNVRIPATAMFSFLLAGLGFLIVAGWVVTTP